MLLLLSIILIDFSVSHKIKIIASVNPVIPGIFNKPGLPGRGNLAPLLFCFVFTAARSADVAVERLRELSRIAAKMQVSGLSS